MFKKFDMKMITLTLVLIIFLSSLIFTIQATEPLRSSDISSIPEEDLSGSIETIQLIFEGSTLTEYPPLPPEDRGSPIPFYEGDTLIFILVLIVIAAVGWTAFTYYRYMKRAEKYREKKRKSQMKRY